MNESMVLRSRHNFSFWKWWVNPILTISFAIFFFGCAIIVICVLVGVANWNLLTGWLLGWMFSWWGFGLRNMCVVLTLKMMNKYFIFTSFLLRMLFYAIPGLIYSLHPHIFNPLLIVAGLIVFHFALYGWLILGDLKNKYGSQPKWLKDPSRLKIVGGAYAIF